MDAMLFYFTTIITAILVCCAIFFLFFFLTSLFDARDKGATKSRAKFYITGPIGVGVNFIDVLGVGSFAPATGLLKLFKQCPDKFLPGTLNAGFAIPVVYQAIVFINVIVVDPATLLAMMVAAAAGAYAGAGVVSRFSEQVVRIGLGLALIVTAGFMVGDILGMNPAGGHSVGLSGEALAIGVGVNFVLGALMTIGMGFYAPCMAMVYYLGMDPRVAFPIMMCSSALLMSLASIRFIRAGAIDHSCCLFMTIFGCIGVYLAIPHVTTMDIALLKQVVIVITVLTSLSMFFSFIRHRLRAGKG